MKDKRFLIIISLVLMGIFLAGAVCASSQTVELDGVKFNIPDGYKENIEYAKNGEIEQYQDYSATKYVRGYEDKEGNILGVSVFEYDIQATLDDVRYDGDVDKEICGIKGLYCHDDFDSFKYNVGDKFAMIEAPDLATIEEVLGSDGADGASSASADAKVKSFSLDSGPVSTVSMFDCMDVTGKIVIDLSSVDDAQVKLLEKNYDVKKKSDSKDLDDNTVGDLKWRIKLPGTNSELKVSSASFDDDKLTLKIKGKVYEPSDPSGSSTIKVDKYDKVKVKMTFFDENSNEYVIEAK